MRLMLDPVSTAPCVLVAGMFDGVHRGHQALLSLGRREADARGLPLTVLTFEPHPLCVLRPEKAPPRLTTQNERAQLMAAWGVDTLCVNSFTPALAAQTPEDFVRDMVRRYQPKAVITGFNFTFGDHGYGNVDTLRAMASTCGYDSLTVPEVVLDGATVSSTRIRGLLQSGELAAATRLLGHTYTLSGRVDHGKSVGRTMGFPTANITPPPDKALPAFGVYACYLRLQSGDVYRAVVNVGRHPTLPEGAVTVEAHVLNEDLALYGQVVQLIFMSFRRRERAFDSVDALREQIARDVEDARACLAQMENA